MLLVIQTASAKVEVALMEEQSLKLVHSLSKEEDRPQQSKLLFSLLEQIFQASGVDRTQVSALAVNRGPGSYTGLRVGLSFAQTWVFGASIPLYSYERRGLEPIQTLKKSDLHLVESLSELEPIYENDHFGSRVAVKK